MASPNNNASAPTAKSCNSWLIFRCDSFYNIPSSLGKSPKPGIGLGKKVDLVKRNDSPSPNKYNAISDFDLSKKNLSMGKFSLGRDVSFLLILENENRWHFYQKLKPSTWKLLSQVQHATQEQHLNAS